MCIKRRLLQIFLAVFFVAAVQTSSAATQSELEILNLTGRDIKTLYLYPSGMDSWPVDLLDTDILRNGYSATVRYNGDYIYYDMKIIFMDNSHREWFGNQRLNIKNARRLIIRKSRTANDGKEIFSVYIDRGDD